MINARVSSEVGPLKRVIVHRPDDGIEMVTPKLAETFLYDDIVFLPRMREEHDLFTEVLGAFLGDEVYDTQELLLEVLTNSAEATEKLLDYVIEDEECDDATQKVLKDMNVTDLVYTLFTGINRKTGKLIFNPLPNYVFTRDIGVVINDHILVCQASREARTRENILTRCIVYYHPLFKEMAQYDRILDLTKEAENITLEGGDVMVIDKHTLFIGCSERTTSEAIELLTGRLFDKGIVKRVVKIDIPNERASMHIDTLFTQISEREMVVFEPFLLKPGRSTFTVYEGSLSKTNEFQTLDALMKHLGKDMKFIKCGNGINPYDEREQWTDGCNLVAVKDGVAIAYGRNEHTSIALENAGYNVVDAETFMLAYDNNILDPDAVEKMIISIPATELSRARGGPHCMTMPVLRG